MMLCSERQHPEICHGENHYDVFLWNHGNATWKSHYGDMKIWCSETKKINVVKLMCKHSISPFKYFFNNVHIYCTYNMYIHIYIYIYAYIYIYIKQQTAILSTTTVLCWTYEWSGKKLFLLYEYWHLEVPIC